MTWSASLYGRKYDIACGQIDIGNVATDMTERMADDVPQADGSMVVDNGAQAVVFMANPPLDANAQFLIVVATKTPFIGRE